MEEVRLPQGTIHYRESGSGEPIVFAHGLLVNGTPWRKVVPLLERGLPLHRPRPSAWLTSRAHERGRRSLPPGLARIVDEFIASLGLEQVTLVANDTGGAIAQITAANHPDRIGRLVLTNCDAVRELPAPRLPPLQWTARVPGLLTVALQGMRFDLLRRRSPMAFGWLIKHDLKGGRRWRSGCALPLQSRDPSRHGQDASRHPPPIHDRGGGAAGVRPTGPR